jgi:hypothetical protein
MRTDTTVSLFYDKDVNMWHSMHLYRQFCAASNLELTVYTYTPWTTELLAFKEAGINIIFVDQRNLSYNLILQQFVTTDVKGIIIIEGGLALACQIEVSNFISQATLPTIDSYIVVPEGAAASYITAASFKELGYVDCKAKNPMTPYHSLQLTEADGYAKANQVALCPNTIYPNKYGHSHAGAFTPDMGVPISALHGYVIV